MVFCWLFTLLVMAAFTDMVAGTFVGKGVEGMTKATGYANSAAASISMLFIVVAIIFGLIQSGGGNNILNRTEGEYTEECSNDVSSAGLDQAWWTGITIAAMLCLFLVIQSVVLARKKRK